MINKLKILSFKSVEEVIVDLGPLNIFVGDNGTGKSNLLEAIGVLGAAASGRVDEGSLHRRGVRQAQHHLSAFKESELDFMEIEASGARMAYGASLSPSESGGAWEFNYERLSLDGSFIDTQLTRRDIHRGMAALIAVELDRFNNSLVPLDPHSHLINVIQDFAIFNPKIEVLKSKRQDLQPRHPLGLSGGGLIQLGQEFIETCQGLGLLEPANLVCQAAGNGQRLSLNLNMTTGPGLASDGALTLTDKHMKESVKGLDPREVGTGILHVVFIMMLATLKSTPLFFAIDAFDHGLSIVLAHKLLAYLREAVAISGKQIILTTTNPDWIRKDLVRDREDVRIFRVTRSESGRTLIRQVFV